MNTTATATKRGKAMNTPTRVPTLMNEVYRGEGDMPKTQHSKNAFVIHNSGKKPVGVETQSERGDTCMKIPSNGWMVLDARVSGFSTDGPVHVSFGKLTQDDIDELDRLEKENQDEEFAEHGFRRPGHPCYVRQGDNSDDGDGLALEDANMIPIYFNRKEMLNGNTPISRINEEFLNKKAIKSMLEVEASTIGDDLMPPPQLAKIKRNKKGIYGVWNECRYSMDGYVELTGNTI